VNEKLESLAEQADQIFGPRTNKSEKKGFREDRQDLENKIEETKRKIDAKPRKPRNYKTFYQCTWDEYQHRLCYMEVAFHSLAKAWANIKILKNIFLAYRLKKGIFKDKPKDDEN
ncbi:hypothetical protein KII05_11400, partial [Weissella confusa]|uniref:hypothetical protein n=1 Tax=Weissella confusa TaxID=1583 RepID=UPI001BD08FDD